MVAHDDTLARRLNEIERQIRDLATSRRASNTTITDDDGNVVVRLTRDGLVIYDPSTSEPILWLGPSGLTMYDGDGDSRTHVGRLGSGSYGLLVLDADGSTPRLHINERGILSPYLSASFRGIIADVQVTTSGSFQPLFSSTLEMIVSPAFHCSVVASCPADTTGEMRLRIPVSGAVTDAVPIPAGGTAQHQFRWIHGLALNTGPVAVDVEARRTGGAGDVEVARPSGLWQADDGFSTPDGVP